MNIIVCIKQVPDTTEIKIDPVKGTLIREGVPSIMNPDDKGGLELALRLKDQFGGLCRSLDYDLIIAGRQAIDGDTAQVGPEMAEHLGLPQVTYVCDAKLLPNGNLQVHKENEDSVQVLEVEGKCLLTVLASAFEPRYMTVSGIVEAYNREVEVWGADKIDYDETKLGLSGSPTKVFQSFPKAMKAPGEVHEVSEEEAVELIVNKLKEKHII